MSSGLHWLSQLPEDFWWVTLGTFVVQELAFLIFNGFCMIGMEANSLTPPFLG